MRTALFVVLSALLAGVVVGDLVSTNPDGQAFFNPLTVKSLNLGELAVGTIINQTDYADFYYIWVPSYVSEVYYYLNVTNGGTSDCSSYVEAYVFTSESESSFPCDNAYSNSIYCDTYDTYVYTYDTTDYTYSNLYYYLRPGRYHYVTVSQGYSEYNCDYNFYAEATQSCPNTTVPLYVDSGNFTCTSFYNYTVNNQNIAGFLNNSDSLMVYGVNVPANVSRIWAFVSTSDAYYLYLTANQAYASYDYYHSDDETDYGYQNSTNGIYNYYVELDVPLAGWTFFTVFPELSVNSSGLHYNITIGWNYCGSSSVGLGDWNVNQYVPYTYYSIADCSVPVVQNMNLTTQSAWTFNVPAYNTTTNEYAAAVAATINVPWGTSGYVNLTCNTTDTTSDTYITIAKGYIADCDYYDDDIYCDYVGGTYSEYLYLISQDLFTGGQYTIAICNYNTVTGVTVVVQNNGVVAAPAAPSPSATPSPGSAASASPSSNADNGSSNAFSVFPAFALVALAALLALLF